MSQNWLEMAKLQKKPLTSISNITAMQKHHETLQKMLQAQLKVRRIDEARKEDEVSPDKNNAEDEGVKLVGEAEGAMHDVHNMDIDTMDLLEHVGLLNEDQWRIFDQVSDHLNHQRRHKITNCKCKATPHVCQWGGRNWKIVSD